MTKYELINYAAYESRSRNYYEISLASRNATSHFIDVIQVLLTGISVRG